MFVQQFKDMASNLDEVRPRRIPTLPQPLSALHSLSRHLARRHDALVFCALMPGRAPLS